MKNKTLIMMMTAMIAGAMVIGTVAYVPAATEETAEASTDDADAELKSQLYGVWPVNLDSYIFVITRLREIRSYGILQMHPKIL